MEETKLNFTFPDAIDQDKPVTVILRAGEAEPIKDNVKVFGVAVTIDSISEWVAKRSFKTPIISNESVIIFSTKPGNPYIELHEDPKHKEATILTSQLKKNPDLAAFCINQDVYFDAKSLVSLLRKYAHCFTNGPAHAKALIDSCRNMEAKLETELQRKDDRSGNTTDSIKKALKFVTGELPKQISLNCPLYEDMPDVQLTLEIEVEVRNSAPQYAFYSMEYDSLLRDKAKEYILNVVTPLREIFVCLEK